MDSGLLLRLVSKRFICSSCRSKFRQLPRQHSLPALRTPRLQRGLATRSKDIPKPHRSESTWQQRTDFPRDATKEFNTYPQVSAKELRGRRQRPKRVRMLLREFIEDSLYNPNYGYFPKEAVIFTPGRPFDFSQIQDELDFQAQLGERYTAFEDKLDADFQNDVRQLWHTPTELFKPHYGEAIARYLIASYKLSLYPFDDLIIYEMGAGNGTLMVNILDYIRKVDPEVYERTKFRIIEISGALAEIQEQQLVRSKFARDHQQKVEIVNRSIFDWDEYVSSPCFFLALEVFDNFAHDAIRYDPLAEHALQAHVLIDGEGDMFEMYTRHIDETATQFLELREQACETVYPHPLRASSRARRRLRSLLPLAPNLTVPEYIPTRLMEFFQVLAKYFPAHRLVASDFHKLPDAVAGINAPVVQTRYKRRMVPVSTPLVHQGYFDILFPTDFSVMEQIYQSITGRLTRVIPQPEFLKMWAPLPLTQTRNGENPLLNWYQNASVMVTV